jgi:hypothetical protein
MWWEDRETGWDGVDWKHLAKFDVFSGLYAVK